MRLSLKAAMLLIFTFLTVSALADPIVVKTTAGTATVNGQNPQSTSTGNMQGYVVTTYNFGPLGSSVAKVGDPLVTVNLPTTVGGVFQGSLKNTWVDFSRLAAGANTATQSFIVSGFGNESLTLNFAWNKDAQGNWVFSSTPPLTGSLSFVSGGFNYRLDYTLVPHPTDPFNPLFGKITNLGQAAAPIPEPATLILLGTGLAGTFAAARRKRRTQQ